LWKKQIAFVENRRGRACFPQNFPLFNKPIPQPNCYQYFFNILLSKKPTVRHQGKSHLKIYKFLNFQIGNVEKYSGARRLPGKETNCCLGRVKPGASPAHSR